MRILTIRLYITLFTGYGQASATDMHPPRTHAISDQTFTGNQFPSVHEFDIISHTFYLFFFIFGTGNSSYIALNKPVINALSSTSSTKSISFAP